MSGIRIVITGSTGVVGSVLVPALQAEGHHITRLKRTGEPADSTIILWDPEASHILEKDRLEGVDAVIHLAGASIGTDRWTPEKKATIRNSRVQGTGLLARTLSELKQKPRLFISSSDVAWYGDRGEEKLTEDARRGSGFLSGVCRDWEEATQPAEEANIRVVKLRMGTVLTPGGGVLGIMLPVFRKGIGGKVGGGKQYLSWILPEEVASIIRHVIQDERLEGPVNAVVPQPVRNKEFAHALGHVLARPALFPLPSFAAHLMMGEKADELLLNSARVVPSRLLETGYIFQFPDLEAALRHVLNGH